jgi:hypothetical protein
MQQNRKFYGMTPLQLGILAGLTGAACLLFGWMGWFVLRGNMSRFGHTPENTPVPQVTSTMIIIPTSTPTETPTPLPYAMLIPNGWAQFKTGLVEIWLPANFKPGDPKLLNDSTKFAIPELIMRGAASKSSLYQMLATVSYEPLTTDSLDAFLDGKVAKFPTEIRVAERRHVSVNSTDTIRLLFETRSQNVDVNIMTYVFLDGSTIWYVEYGAQINEFYDMLPTFEDSVKTFRIVR